MTVKLNWDESVLVATIDRPERRNAVDQQTLLELANALDESVLRKTRVVIITGTAPAFCSGADLSGVRETEFTDALHKFLMQLATLPSVTIAAIAGHALGAGAQIAMSCDLRVATAQSVIGVPAARLGLVVNHWTVERLARSARGPWRGRCCLRQETILAPNWRTSVQCIAWVILKTRLVGRMKFHCWHLYQ